MDDSSHVSRPGTGVLFFEPEERRKSEKSPHYKGFILLDRAYTAGEKLKLVAWLRNTRNGSTLLSVMEDTGYKDWKDDRKNAEAERQAVKNEPKEVRRGYAAPKPKPRQQGDYDDDLSEVPF
jgi:hypothetical protein